MRNIFDQYTQWENRLTHALVTALAEDHKLLHAFVYWVTGVAPKSAKLQIVEQRLPGEAELAEGESERRGLPDAWIHDNDRWCLLVESKVAASLSNDQLRRHLRTAAKRFDEITLLALDVVEPHSALPDVVIFRQWRDVYQWLIKKSAQSEWARRAAQYLEVAENRMVAEGYLREGTLTTFSGIPFNGDEPYSYPEAKRVLKLALEQLRTNKHLNQKIGMDPSLGGRSAITGRDGVAVWDFLQLRRAANADESFTKYPHLTLSIESDRLLAMITIPHGIRSTSRRNLVGLGTDGFEALLKKVNMRLQSAIRATKGAAPWCIVVQRRYPSQRADAIIDARIEYDLRTAFLQSNNVSSIKIQSQWMQATYDALRHKRSNLQVSIGASFPYKTCASTSSPKILDTVANVWIACEPLLNVLLQEPN